MGRAGTALEGTIDLQKLAQTFPGVLIKMSDEAGVQLVWDDGKPDIKDVDPPEVPALVEMMHRIERYPIPEQVKEQVEEMQRRAAPLKAEYDAAWEAWMALPTEEKATQEFHDRIIRECMRANTEPTETRATKTEEEIQVALWKGPVSAQEV
jgi:hypothetical protein